MALNKDSTVYRIIGIESFLSILMNKEERYVRPIDSWQDTFEGYMLHQLDSDTETIIVKSELRQLFFPMHTAILYASGKTRE